MLTREYRLKIVVVPSPNVRMRSTSIALAVFVLLDAVVIARDNVTSKFTSTAPKDSVIINRSGQDEIESFSALCPGFGDYQLILEEYDGRSWINVKYGNTVVDLRYGWAGFPAKANDLVEWRGILKGDTFVPYAIIYRLKMFDSQARRDRSRLIVIKLDGDKSAIVGETQGADEDTKAKKIADMVLSAGREMHEPNAGLSQGRQESARGPQYELPSGAVTIEAHGLGSLGLPDRKLVLWMLNPENHPSNHTGDDPYSCTEYTRGSYYSGPTRVSLVNSNTGTIINTVEVKEGDSNGQDTFDIPYAIRKGYYYEVEGEPKKGKEAKPRLLSLKDYNGDRKAAEFALFYAQACMGLACTLIGYS